MDHPVLYEIARKVCHDHGLPWTDPRTGETYPPPASRALQAHLTGCVTCRSIPFALCPTGATLLRAAVEAIDQP